jgi:hypothetical protein
MNALIGLMSAQSGGRNGKRQTAPATQGSLGNHLTRYAEAKNDKKAGLSRNHAVEKQSPPIPALGSEWPQGIRALARVAARPYEGSRGFQPTDHHRPPTTPRRGATHETVLNQWRL